METVESYNGKSLYTALVEFQSEMKPMPKNKDNPFFKSGYTDLRAVVEEIYPMLHDKGILVLQPIQTINGFAAVVTTIIHVRTGEKLESTYPLFPSKPNDPMALAASATYARRLSLVSALGLVSGDVDDDGVTASGKNHAAMAVKTTQAVVKPTAGADGVQFSTFVPAGFNTKERTTKAGKPVTSYSVKDPDGVWYSTLDNDSGMTLGEAHTAKTELRVGWKINGDFKNIVSVEVAQEVSF